MHLSNKAVLVTSLLTLLGAATVVHATDNYSTNRKSMSGAQCQPSTGSQWGDIVINPDGIRNIHPSFARYISCTIPIDADDDFDQSDFDSSTPEGGFTFELGFDYSQAKVGGAVNTTCTLYRKDSDSTTTTEAFTVTSVQTSELVTTAVSPEIMDGASPFDPDVFSFNCKLNPGIKLSYIKWYEYENTGGYYYTP